MVSKTIPITLSKEDVLKLDNIAESELSSRNRILRLAILNYLKENGKKTRK